ncbi:hypothetical protein R3P38DRAFT_3229512 [Favolaschia claudopus]|uniref:Uncharacterized protein n=1 Tax=Favolaschia claudopus TaxID=2862362 RepID=A0AAV9ZNM2_9AGAR
MSFGDPPQNQSDPSETGFRDWTTLLPFAGEHHYKFKSVYYHHFGSSIQKTTSPYSEWDTGCAFCFLEDKFVQDYYSKSKTGFKLVPTARDPYVSRSYYYYALPSDTQLEDIGTVGVDLGGTPMHFDARWLPDSEEQMCDVLSFYSLTAAIPASKVSKSALPQAPACTRFYCFSGGSPRRSRYLSSSRHIISSLNVTLVTTPPAPFGVLPSQCFLELKHKHCSTHLILYAVGADAWYVPGIKCSRLASPCKWSFACEVSGSLPPSPIISPLLASAPIPCALDSLRV